MTDVAIPTKKGQKTNERPGTRAQARHIRFSAYKAREVLDLIRGKDVQSAAEILQFSERDAAIVIGKLLRSAVANAQHNDDIPGDDLYVSACFADEGKTIRRFRPRARGRATRIRKRSCHITIIVSRMPEAQLERRRAKDASRPGSRAARRAGQVAAEQQQQTGSRRRRRSRGGAAPEAHDHDHDHDEQPTAAEVAAAEDELDIVDQQAVAVAEVEAQQDEETTVADTPTEETAAEEAGIVDQQEAAVEAIDDAETDEEDGK